MEGYKVTVVEASVELTKKDKIRITDTTDTIAMDKATQDGELIIDPAFWAVLEVHNEKSQDKDYRNFIIADKNGLKFRTGSESFWTAFRSIWDELKDEDDWQVKVYRLPSRNRQGKDFLTCSLV